MLSSDVALVKHLDLVLVENFGGGVEVFCTHDDPNFFFGAGEKGIDVVDVDFGLQEGTGNVFETGGVCNFYADDIGFTEEEAMLVEQGTSFVDPVDHYPENGIIGGVYGGQCHDVDLGLIEEVGELAQTTHFVFGVDTELYDGIAEAPSYTGFYHIKHYYVE